MSLIDFAQPALDCIHADAMRHPDQADCYNPRRTFWHAARRANLHEAGWLVMLMQLLELSASPQMAGPAAEEIDRAAPPARPHPHRYAISVTDLETGQPGGPGRRWAVFLRG
jgi:hypothetical protein